MLLRSYVCCCVRSCVVSTIYLLLALGSAVANASYILADEGQTTSRYHFVIDETKSTAAPYGLISVDPEQELPTYGLSGQFDATLVHSWWSFVNPELGDHYFGEEMWLRFSNVALVGTPIPFELLDVGGDGGDTTLLSSNYCGPAWPDTYMSCYIRSLSGNQVSLQGSEISLSGRTDSGHYQFAITANLVAEPSTISLVSLACAGFLFRRDNKARRFTRAV